MAYCFGVSNHSPEVVVRALVKAKAVKSVSEVGIAPVNSRIARNPRYKFYLFLNASDMLKNMEFISSKAYSQVYVILFANAMKINELKGMIPLDFDRDPEHPGFGFKLRPLDLAQIKKRKEPNAIERRKRNYLGRLVQFVRKGSLLNPLMTLIYTLPSVKQALVKEAVVKWLFLGKPQSALDGMLDSLDGEVLSKKTRQRLKDILFTDIGRNYQEAFKLYREQKRSVKDDRMVDVVAIVKKLGVSDYEMSYILSIMNETKNTKSRKYTDSYDKARNRKL